MEFLIARARDQDQLAHATVIAYQTVRCWAMTKSNKGKMPSFKALLPRDRNAPAQTPAEMRAALNVIVAGKMGRFVKMPPRSRKK